MTYKILELVQGMEKGGRTKRIIETTVGLSRHGWDVRILSMNQVADFVKERYKDQVQWVDLNKRPNLDLQYIFSLARLIRKESFSLIHAHCEASYFYGGIAGKLCGIPVVGTYHRSDLAYFDDNWKLRFFARLLTRAVAISNDRMRLMHVKLKIPEKKITLIHGGIDLDEFSLLSGKEIELLKDKLDLSGKIVLLSLGHLGKIKGHDITIKALPRVLKLYPDVMLVIAGDGAEEDYQRLSKLISTMNLEEHVRLVGQVHNVIQWLNICDLFVQPSLEEGFGLVFVEAGACKKAVVSTAVGGIKDIVLNGQTGLLVNPGRVDELEDAFIEVISDKEKRTRFGEAGYERVNHIFSLENMSEKYHQLFIEILNIP